MMNGKNNPFGQSYPNSNMIVKANRANPISDLLAQLPRSLLVSGRLAALDSFSVSLWFSSALQPL